MYLLGMCLTCLVIMFIIFIKDLYDETNPDKCDICGGRADAEEDLTDFCPYGLGVMCETCDDVATQTGIPFNRLAYDKKTELYYDLRHAVSRDNL